MRKIHRLFWVLVPIFISASTTHAQTDVERADFDGNGIVDFGDFLTFAAGFGAATGEEAFDATLDLNASGQIDFADFLVFAGAFGDSTAPPTTTFVYIADTAAGEVKAFDTSTNFQDPARRLVAHTPQDVFFSGLQQRFFVSSLDTFYAFDNSGTLTYATPLTEVSDLGFVVSRGGSKMAVSPDHSKAYLSEAFGPVVEIINLVDGQSEGFIDVAANPHGIQINAAGTRLFIGHGGANVSPTIAPITVIDTNTRTVIDTFSVGNNGVNRLAVSPIDGTLYTNNATGGTILAIDPSSGAILQSVDVAGVDDLSVQILDVGVAPDGQLVYYTVSRIISVFDQQGNTDLAFIGGLGIVEATTFERVDEVQLGEVMANVGITPDGSTAYVSGSDNLEEVPPSIKIFIVDLDTREAAGTLQGFELPSDISFAPEKPVLKAVAWPDVRIF